MLSTIPEIVDELRQGRPIILVDDEDRENEGDLVFPAERATAEVITFITRYTPGYLCVTLTGADCERLDLPPQAPANTSLRGTAMMVSVDGHPHHGVGTGISASDRARAARLLADPSTRPDDLVRPGHIVPLRARDGGVLVRTGQTEGSVDLMRLAGLHPAAVISEISREDGEMARMPDLEAFAREHRLLICSVEQVIQYRLRRERLVRREPPVEGITVDTDHGRFTLITYRTTVDRLPQLAFCVGDVGRLDPSGMPKQIAEPTLVRMQRRDLLGDVFGDKSHPSNRVLEASLRRIQAEGHGVLVYLRPDVAEEGMAETRRAQPMNERDSGIGCQILRDLGLTQLRLLTNHPRRLQHIDAFGLEVVESIAIDL